MKTNWQDPLSGEITSPLISGLQEAVGKIEDSIGLQTTAETAISLVEVYINADDRYRIFQAPLGKRNWVASPAPVIKKNGVAITTGFTIDYGGGAIVLETNALSTDVFTADFTRTNGTHSITPASIGAESKTDADAHKAESATNAHLAKNIGIEDTGGNFTATDVEGALSELFTSVSDGKDAVGTAITDVDPDVTVPTSPTFAELATAIGQISTGKKSAAGSGTTPASNGGSFNITDLEFQPSFIEVEMQITSTIWVRTVYVDSPINSALNNRFYNSDGSSNAALSTSFSISSSGFSFTFSTATFYNSQPYKWRAVE